jgi:hypothetical protein
MSGYKLDNKDQPLEDLLMADSANDTPKSKLRNALRGFCLAQDMILHGFALPGHVPYAELTLSHYRSTSHSSQPKLSRCRLLYLLQESLPFCVLANEQFSCNLFFSAKYFRVIGCSVEDQMPKIAVCVQALVDAVDVRSRG